MGTWLLYSEDGQHLGPVPSEYVARAVKSGAVQANRWITEADQLRWRPLAEVPEICALLEQMSRGAASPEQRDRTVVALSEAFPAFPGTAPQAGSVAPSPTERGGYPSGPPATMTDVAALPGPSSAAPSSDEPMSSERTVIAPSVFEDANPSDPKTKSAPGVAQPAAGAAPADLEITARQAQGVAQEVTLRSPKAPAGMVIKPLVGVVDPITATVPAAAWQQKAPLGQGATVPSGQAVPQVEATPRPTPRAVMTPTGPREKAPPPEGKDESDGSSVIAFFLGGLALGAVVVVGMLVWAFRSGVLR